MHTSAVLFPIINDFVNINIAPIAAHLCNDLVKARFSLQNKVKLDLGCAMTETRVTAEDVARLAGVSRSTVSRAFTPGRVVNKDTRAIILRAAKKLGYEPNALAQALISKRSQIVGVMMGELSNPFHAVLHQALGRSLHEHGLIPVSAQLVPGESASGFISMFRQYQVNVVVLTSHNFSVDWIDALRNAGLKVVLLNRVDEERYTSAICADHAQGGYIAARHLLERGCTRIGVCEGTDGYWTSATRLQGHLKGLEAAGQTPVFVSKGDYTYASGSACAERILNGDLPTPDGLLCPNDLFAIGLMDRLRARAGMRFPEDIAVIGFDDIPMGAWEGNSLTTVRLPIGQMADRTAEVIARNNSGTKVLDETIWIPCRIVARSSA
ncbi:LacI family DNA-binding transcriptional regulator [Sulfitobacter sp. W074]|uniref:LacI family DNA-binding transcriptional regulator n=1 Tax=Sulfitobacter sp. W074 TaxID=2867026 RepID=UPI0021A6F26A|nr:LacI family DNA-binding transcriptional regulator [Sulfitobacter sp. W074]UWR38413.1 LacI family transcriptional regulator [Sulfitobacter sp. W074]